MTDELAEESVDEDIVLVAYQEARQTAIEVYMEITKGLKKKKLQEMGEEYEDTEE